MSKAVKQVVPNLMRPHEVEDAKGEVRNIRDALEAPAYIRGKVTDLPNMAKRRSRLEAQIDAYAPKPFKEEELDKAIALSNELESKIREGMPTSAEMRRNPPGAVSKHIGWQKTKSKMVQAWKTVQLRLRESGAVADHLVYGHDIANVERIRPTGHDTRELNMDYAQITGKDIKYGKEVGKTTVFNEEQLAMLQQLDPDMRGQLFSLNQVQRARVKDFVQAVIDGDIDADGNELASRPKTAADSVSLGFTNVSAASLDDLTMAQLRSRAKQKGINTFKMGKEAIKSAIMEQQVISNGA